MLKKVIYFRIKIDVTFYTKEVNINIIIMGYTGYTNKEKKIVYKGI